MSELEKKFKIGEVVHVTYATTVEAYGIIVGRDPPYWLVKIGDRDVEISNEVCLRSLTMKEKGSE
jgi:hypothetical protein